LEVSWCFGEHGLMVLEVRRIRASEWRRYRELRLEALQDSPLAFVEQYRESLAQPDQFWQDRVERAAAGSTSSMFVAIRAERFVAKASCFVESDITQYVSAHVVGVYVTPQSRAEGVADALLAAVIGWAQDEAHANRIRLFVMQTNDRAVAFYRRIGFVTTGATMAYPPDPTYSEHEMEYRVNR
jgi:ribosomal protein S18 acetylase RimI-like enzyme